MLFGLVKKDFGLVIDLSNLAPNLEQRCGCADAAELDHAPPDTCDFISTNQ